MEDRQLSIPPARSQQGETGNVRPSWLCLLFFVSVAVPDGAAAQVVANPGPVVLTLDLLQVEYDRADLEGPPFVGFRFDASARPQCSDGRNNDDHRSVGQGRHDAAIDYPDDPECVSPQDDSEDKAGLQPRAAVVLTGHVDADGDLFFPAEGVHLPPRYHRSAERALGGDGVVINTFVPTGPVRGRIDPVRGTVALELNVRLRFEVDNTGRLSGPGDHCYLGTEDRPHTLVLIADRREAVAGVHPKRPRGYYADDGMVVLAGTNPGRLGGASCCGLFCFGDAAVDHAFGMPGEPGSATLAAIGRFDPPVAARPASGSLALDRVAARPRVSGPANELR